VFERSRDDVPEPKIEFGPDRQPTAESWVDIERAARAGDVVSMANFGLGLHQRGERAAGLRWLERAWQAGNAGAGFNLGTFYLMQGDTNRAEVMWENAAERGDPDAAVGLLRLALERGDHARALGWLPPVLDQDESYPIVAVGVAFRDHGDVDTALRVLRRAIDLGDPYAMQYTADILDARGDTGDAAELRARARAVWERTGGDDAEFR
jgi:TPR repeat protein